METESSVEGNLQINLLPAFSSESFSGLNRHTTLILHSPDPSAILSGGGDCFSVIIIKWLEIKKNTVVESTHEMAKR